MNMEASMLQNIDLSLVMIVVGYTPLKNKAILTVKLEKKLV